MTSADKPFNHFYTPENSRFYARNVYRPLDPETDDFRFLEILPGRNDDILKCNLIQSSQDLKYEALSYRAGDPKHPKEILVNGHPFNVFASLFGALVRLRNLSESRFVWIDQICINQNNIIERNHQVGKMRTVYQYAERVVAWLGPLGEGEIAIDAIHGFYDVYIQREASFRKELASPRELEPMEMATIRQSVSDDYMKELVLANQPDGGVFLDKAKALGHLYNSDFWGRVWIWQELIVARSIQLLWDIRSMDVEPFFIVGRILLQLKDDEWTLQPLQGIDLIFRPLGKPWSLVRMVITLNKRPQWRRYNALDFKSLLDSSRGAQSSDPRDKVYAVFGLVPQTYKLAPDYSDTIASVYCSTVWSIISAESSLNILAYCNRPMTQGSISLPTWCPDWSVKSGSKRQGLLSHDFPTYSLRFNACKTLAGSCRMEALKEKEGEVLKFVLYVNGLVIDHIEELGELPPSITNSKDETYNDILRSWLSTINKKRHVSEALKAELDRTAIVDDRGYPGTRKGRTFLDASNYRRLKLDIIEGNRRFFVTEKGLMGMAPPHVSSGDIICVLPGTKVPILLRKVEKFYILVGEVYVSDGYMEGRAFDEMERGERSLEEFEIY